MKNLHFDKDYGPGGKGLVPETSKGHEGMGRKRVHIRPLQTESHTFHQLQMPKLMTKPLAINLGLNHTGGTAMRRQ